jgi:hypothetical protein
MPWRTTPSTRPAPVAAVLAAVALGAAACGGGEPAAPPASGPANALVVTAGGRSVSLAPSGGCVRRAGRVMCGDPPAPRCIGAALPRIPLAPGGAITMEFSERPRLVEASIGPGTPLRERPGEAAVTWRPDGRPARPSPLVVLADLPVGRLAYTACVVPTG